MKKITSILTIFALAFAFAISLSSTEAKAYSETIDYTRAVYYVDTYEELKAACEATSYDRTIILEKDITVGYEDFVSAGSSDNYMKDYQITIKGDTAVLIDLNGFNYSVLSRNTNFVFAVRENATVHFINSHPTALSSIKFDVNNNPVHGGVGINYENTTSLVNVNTTGGFYSDNVSYLLGEFDLSEQAGDDKYITNNDKRVTTIFLQSAKEVVMHSGTVNNVYSGGRGIHVNSASSSKSDFKVELSNMNVKAGGYAIASTCAKSLTFDFNVRLESLVIGQCMFTLSTGDAAKVANILGKDKLDNTPVVYSTDRYTAASSDTKIDNLGANAYFIYEGYVIPDLSSIQHDTSMILPQGHVFRFDYSGMWCRLESHNFTLDENGHAYCRCSYEEKYEVVLSKKSYTYDGTAKEPSVTLKVGGVEVPSGYYTVEYENNVNVGTAKVKIIPDKNVGMISGTVTATYKINPINISGFSATLKQYSFGYTGQYIKPVVTVKGKVNGKEVTLTNWKDYKVNYKNFKNAGTATMEIVGRNSYTGKITLTFTIRPMNLSKCSASLNQTSFTYTGEYIKPVVNAYATLGGEKVALVNWKDYKATYSNFKVPGKATITLTGRGNYTGTKTLTFTIKPKTTFISSLTAGAKKLTVNWKAITEQVTGYEIQYATASNFSGAKTVTVTSNKTASKAITGLTTGKTYYVRVRTYKTATIDGKATKVYSNWSAVKSVKVK